MNMIDLLIQDHDKLRKQLKMIHQCLSQNCLKEKVDGFVRSYQHHESLEEGFLFPSLMEHLKNFPDRRNLIADYESTHKDMWSLMNRMLYTLEYSRFEALQKAFFEFSAAAEMHLDSEERILFPMIRELVDEQTLEDWGARAEEWSFVNPHMNLYAGVV